MNNPMQILSRILSGGGNPQQMVQSLIQKNPQFNALLNQQKQSGMTMEQFVRQYAQQKGIDINPMLDMVKKRGMR